MSCSPSSVRTKNKASGLDKKLAGNIDLRSLTVVRVERLLKKARFLFFDVNIGFKFNLARVLNLLCHVSWIHATSRCVIISISPEVIKNELSLWGSLR